MRGLTLIAVLGAFLASPAVAFDEERSCAELIEQLHHRRLAEQAEAALALCDLGPEAREAVPRLIELLDVHSDVGTSAHRALVSIGAEAVEHLGEALKHRLRGSYAAKVLQEIGADASPALSRLADAAFDSDVPIHVIEALADIDRDGHTAVPVLCVLLADPDMQCFAAAELEGYPQWGRIIAPRVLPLLNHRRSAVRESAVSLLGCFPDEADLIVPELVPLLSDLDVRVRGATALALGKLGRHPRVVVPALMRHLDDGGRYLVGVMCFLPGCQYEFRDVASDVLEGLAGFPGETDRLLPVAMAELERHPESAASLLRTLAPEPRAIGADLRRVLSKPDLSDESKCTVLGLLGECRVKEAVPAIERPLDHPPPARGSEFDVGLAAAGALVRIDREGHPRAWQRVLDDLGQNGSPMSVAAVTGSDSEEVLPLLSSMVRVGEGPDNLFACLGELGPAAAGLVRHILDGTEDTDWDSTLSLLHKIGPDAIVSLVQVLDSTDRHNLKCARALGTFGKEAWGSVPSLVPLCESDDSETVLASVQALGEIGSWPGKSLPALRQTLTHKRTVVRAATILALASFPDAAAEHVPPFTTALDDDYIIVRRAAAQALGKFGKSAASAREKLERIATDDPSPLVRTAAREALVAIDIPAKR